jgi:hypothetical protein
MERLELLYAKKVGFMIGMWALFRSYEPSSVDLDGTSGYSVHADVPGSERLALSLVQFTIWSKGPESPNI